MSVTKLKTIKKTIAEKVKEIYQQSSGEVVMSDVAKRAAAECDLSSYSFDELVSEVAEKEAVAQAKALSSPVGVDTEAESMQGKLFSDTWLEHGQVHSGTFIKNRFAGIRHNLQRVEKVDNNAISVLEAQRREHMRIAELTRAYASDPTIVNNEQAVDWLKDNE